MYNFYIICIKFYVVDTIAAVELSCANNEDTKYCSGTLIQEQCTVTGDVVIIKWTVLDDRGTVLGVRAYSTGSTAVSPEGIPAYGPERYLKNFRTFVPGNGNPFISNIIFTASLSQDGYMVRCNEVYNAQSKVHNAQSKSCSITTCIAGTYPHMILFIYMCLCVQILRLVSMI